MAPSRAQRSSTAASHRRKSSRSWKALARGLHAYGSYLKAAVAAVVTAAETVAGWGEAPCQGGKLRQFDAPPFCSRTFYAMTSHTLR